MLSTYCAADTLPPPPDHPIKFLLTPRRLKRLQRDRERQTVRWLNFENRVSTVPESSERGFELALYFAVTRNAQRGREAIQWASAHPCQKRQVALILDWAADLVPDAQRGKLLAQACPAAAGGYFAKLRDEVMLVAADARRPDTFSPDLEAKLVDPAELYPFIEYIDVVRSTTHVDLRDSDSPFFLDLPVRFLLSMRPQQLERPSWQAHIAALALVGLDPNLESSQFLQGWGMEERYMVQDGPGVAYEFLWADPYLPGVSYQNMEPWLYDPKGLLLARSDWSEEACWISVGSIVQEQKCPPGWQAKKATFGHLTLIPMVNSCVELAGRIASDTTLLWKIPPRGALSYQQDGEQKSAVADPSGMWRVTPDAHARICRASK